MRYGLPFYISDISQERLPAQTSANKMLRNLFYTQLVPGSLVYQICFFMARLAFTLRLIKPNTTIHYLEVGDAAVVLTPLAGSSSIRLASGQVKTLSLLRGPSLRATKVYVLDRPYSERMQSFYNKKVRNPTNIAKIILLASCRPLRYDSSAEDFNDFLIETRHSLNKDKHLYRTEQILQALKLDSNATQYLSLENDAEFLESLLSCDLENRANSTEEIATFAPPVKFKLAASLRVSADE